MTNKSWLILVVSVLFFMNVARAESIFTTVFNVIESQKTERLLVLSAADGKIYKTFKSEENEKKLKALIGRVVKIDFTTNGTESILHNIQIANPREVDENTMDLNHFRYHQLRAFAPTDLQTFDQANHVFKNMLNDGDKGRSQCFKRAHMWVYDMWSKEGIFSEKIFIFYTKRYAILEDFDWWFHVAPMVTAGGTEYVMDGTFMTKPITVKAWKDHFIKSEKITCPVIEKYQDFEDNQWNRLCYLMKVPMYYFRPLDIENRDKKGIERNHWVLEELQDARRAFKNWEEVYEGLDTGKPTRNH
ncbi:MAG: protein-glutamine glutaminase family protein [Bacteriovoracia bacterium]